MPGADRRLPAILFPATLFSAAFHEPPPLTSMAKFIGGDSMSSIEQDRGEILGVHRNWWHANQTVDIPLMTTCFPVGMNYLMYNYNWHPYFGIEEKVRLWEYYKASGLRLDQPIDVRIQKFEVVGDLAYIACEFEMSSVMEENGAELIPEVQALPAQGTRLTERGRGTEVYKRDDGEGRPLWKIWHFHASPLPPTGTPRPAFNDTADSRGGLGWNPWSEPLSVIGPGRG
jgi:hypothetical protein